MSNENLKKRTKRFALDVIKFFEALPKNEICRVLGRQLLRAGTSVGANYRAAESAYWIELLVEDGKVPETKAVPLLKEANELTAISVSSINTARKSGGRQ